MRIMILCETCNMWHEFFPEIDNNKAISYDKNKLIKHNLDFNVESEVELSLWNDEDDTPINQVDLDDVIDKEVIIKNIEIKCTKCKESIIFEYNY